jgi:predicted transcriptional regulator
MRITVDLSDPLYNRLRAASATCGERGFSSIVATAVEEYLDRQEQGMGGDDAFAADRDAWSLDEAASVEQEARSAWATWPVDPARR